MLLLTALVFVILIARAIACGYLIEPPHTCPSISVATRIRNISDLRHTALQFLLTIIKDFKLETYATFDLSQGLRDIPSEQENEFFLSLDRTIRYTW